MKLKKYILFIFLIVSLTFAIYSMRKMVTPYIPLADINNYTGKVQVMGRLNKNSIRHKDKYLNFAIYENDIVLKVSYKGAVPNNFTNTEQVVVIGKHNQNENIFYADKILTKCPSKYKSKQVK